jgi:hypothetical protein
MQKSVSEKTGYFDFSVLNEDLYKHFDFSTLLSAEEITFANKETVLERKLYPWTPLSNYKLDSAFIAPDGDICVWNTLNRKESPKNVFDTYLTMRLVLAENSTILTDSIQYETQLWRDNSEQKYDMREQMKTKDQLLLGKYKKIAPFIAKAYLNYQKENHISVKKHYQQSDPNIQLFCQYQDVYLSMAYLREHSIEKQQFIRLYAGKAHADVVKTLESFMKQKESELSPEKDINDLIKTLSMISGAEEDCLDFLMDRRIVEDNYQQILLKKKTCKNIVAAYEKHFKLLDQSWNPSEKANKLQVERKLQRSVIALVNSNDAATLDKTVKNMKKANIEAIIEKLK